MWTYAQTSSWNFCLEAKCFQIEYVQSMFQIFSHVIHSMFSLQNKWYHPLHQTKTIQFTSYSFFIFTSNTISSCLYLQKHLKSYHLPNDRPLLPTQQSKWFYYPHFCIWCSQTPVYQLFFPIFNSCICVVLSTNNF